MELVVHLVNRASLVNLDRLDHKDLLVRMCNHMAVSHGSGPRGAGDWKNIVGHMYKCVFFDIKPTCNH